MHARKEITNTMAILRNEIASISTDKDEQRIQALLIIATSLIEAFLINQARIADALEYSNELYKDNEYDKSGNWPKRG